MPNHRQRIIHTTIACLALFTAAAAQAEVYSWTDASGNTVYSDRKTSGKASVTKPNGNPVNYYSAPKPTGTKPPVPSDSRDVTKKTGDKLDKLEAVDGNSNDPATFTEAQCQQNYQLSCDRVVNWKQYAREACGDEDRCKDPDYLDRKYRPRTVDELREVARRAAVRNNRTNDDIALFLKKKYSNYCENQAAMSCKRQRRSNCVDRVIAYCQDPRSLEMILAKYHNLTPDQKRNIIARAKAMATAGGSNELNYEQMISSLIDILVTQAVMGL